MNIPLNVEQVVVDNPLDNNSDGQGKKEKQEEKENQKQQFIQEGQPKQGLKQKEEVKILSESSANDSSIDNSQLMQKEVKKVMEPFEIKKLTWEDFQGIPDDDDPALAHTKWKIGYNYQLKMGENQQYQIDVDVWCKIDSSSWAKTKFQELLNHEQGHYYIGLICALEFKKKVQDFQFSEAYKVEISQLFNNNLKDHLDIERQYDIDTLNMLNTAKQKLWDNKLVKNLKQLSKYA